MIEAISDDEEGCAEGEEDDRQPNLHEPNNQLLAPSVATALNHRKVYRVSKYDYLF